VDWGFDFSAHSSSSVLGAWLRAGAAFCARAGEKLGF